MEGLTKTEQSGADLKTPRPDGKTRAFSGRAVVVHAATIAGSKKAAMLPKFQRKADASNFD